ncbi:MAG: tetratricopeptide repeat protein [Gemmatimonadota bacterium]
MIALAVAAAPLHAQGPRPADLEALLPTLSGVERARVLARLVDAYRLDRPAQAITYGTQALEQLARTPDSAASVLTLSEMGWAYMQLSRFDEAVASADSARRLAERTGQRRGQARAISNLGTIAQRRGDPERAVALFRDALVIQRSLGDEREIANSLNNLGFVYSTDLADYPQALAQHLEALKLREKGGDSATISLSLNNIGVVYGRLRQYDHATQYFNRALTIRRALGNQARIGGTLNNLGDMYLERGNPKRALTAYAEALAIREKSGDPAAISTSHRTLALTYLALGDTVRAERAMALAEEKGLGLEDKGLLVGNLLARSSLARARGLAAVAQQSAERALEVARGMGSRELTRRSLETLSAAQEAAQSNLAALKSLQRAKAVSDSIYNETTTRRIASLETRYAEEKRAKELAAMRRDQAESDLRAARQASQRNAVIAIAVILGLLGLVAYRRRIEHARIAEQLSITDPLTEAKNRRYVEQTITADIAVSTRKHLQAAQRGLKPEEADIVFLLLDIDKFKEINDKHGHAVGDQVLKEVARVLRETCRQSDVVVRWGGEEFLVIDRFTDRSLAAMHAERLRSAVESQVIRINGEMAVRVTCSVGYAAFPFNEADPEADSWMQVIALADHAAYIAKRGGRNRSAGVATRLSAPARAAGAITTAMVSSWLENGTLLLEDDVARGRAATPLPFNQRVGR